MQKINDFIARWQTSGGSEQANSQLFLAELCAVLDLPPPDPAKPVNEENTYSFERKVYIPRGDDTSELKKLDLPVAEGCLLARSEFCHMLPLKFLRLTWRHNSQYHPVKKGLLLHAF